MGSSASCGGGRPGPLDDRTRTFGISPCELRRLEHDAACSGVRGHIRLSLLMVCSRGCRLVSSVDWCSPLLDIRRVSPVSLPLRPRKSRTDEKRWMDRRGIFDVHVVRLHWQLVCRTELRYLVSGPRMLHVGAPSAFSTGHSPWNIRGMESVRVAFPNRLVMAGGFWTPQYSEKTCLGMRGVIESADH
jgi:hypothetical protein